MAAEDCCRQRPLPSNIDIVANSPPPPLIDCILFNFLLEKWNFFLYKILHHPLLDKVLAYFHIVKSWHLRQLLPFSGFFFLQVITGLVLWYQVAKFLMAKFALKCVSNHNTPFPRKMTLESRYFYVKDTSSILQFGR